MFGFLDFGIYSAQELALAMAVVVAAGIVRGITGFGSGLIMVPLLAILWGPVEALGTMVLLGAVATVQLFPSALRLASWRDTAPIVIASFVFSPLGTMLLVSLDPELVKKIIAGLVLGITLISLSGWTYTGPRGMAPGFVAGAVGGVINGVAGVGGPPMVLYLISLPEKAETHRANIVVTLAVTSIAVLISMLAAGVIGTRVVTHTVTFVVPSVVSVWVGAWLFHILPARAFRLLILWFLVAISLAILLA